MKLKCSRAALHEGIQTATRIVGRITTKPILQQVKMEASGGKLILLATDGELGLRMAVPEVDVSEPGVVLVSAARLAALLHEVPDEMLHLETREVEGGFTCKIAGEHSNFELVGDDPKLFPDVIPDFLEAAEVQLKAPEIADMINKTIFAVGSVSTRYAFNGVHFVLQDSTAEMVGTDGHRLAWVKKKVQLDQSVSASVIIASKAVSELSRLISSEEDVIQMRLGAGADQTEPAEAPRDICMQVGGRLLWSRLLEGRFPPYQDVFPKDLDKKVTLPRAPFLSAVRQAALMTTDEARAIKLAFSSGKLTVSSRAPEAGEAQVELTVEYAGEDVEMSFNPQFLADVLRVVEEESVEFAFKESTTPTLIKVGSDYRYLVMPLAIP